VSSPATALNVAGIEITGKVIMTSASVFAPWLADAFTGRNRGGSALPSQRIAAAPSVGSIASRIIAAASRRRRDKETKRVDFRVLKGGE
jgi:hypothetical protein